MIYVNAPFMMHLLQYASVRTFSYSFILSFLRFVANNGKSHKDWSLEMKPQTGFKACDEWSSNDETNIYKVLSYCLYSYLYANVHNEVNNGYLRFCDVFNFTWIASLATSLHTYVVVAQLMKMHRNKFIFIWILSIRYVNVVAHCMALHRETIHNHRCIFQTKTQLLTHRIPGDLISLCNGNEFMLAILFYLFFASINRQNVVHGKMQWMNQKSGYYFTR